MKIWMDDIRDAPDSSWVVCRSTTDIVAYMHQFCEVEILSLDHDMGENEPTGYDLCRWLEELAFHGHDVPKKIVIHSANPVGRKNMQAAIQAIEKFRKERRR